MSELFNRLVKPLGLLPWGETEKWEETHRRAEDVLRAAWEDRTRLLETLQEHIGEMALPNITRTAELHSWMMLNGGDWCLKLNQFIPSPNTGRRSENVHDHTRVITSLTLTGGYTQDLYEGWILREGYELGDPFTLEELPSRVGPETFPGMVYSLDTEVFHALNGFQDGTLTLCLYGKIVKEGIRVFNTVSGRVEQRITYGSAKRMMLDRLHGLGQEKMPVGEVRQCVAGMSRVLAAGV